jgi:hypothetical protein
MLAADRPVLPRMWQVTRKKGKEDRANQTRRASNGKKKRRRIDKIFTKLRIGLLPSRSIDATVTRKLTRSVGLPLVSELTLRGF